MNQEIIELTEEATEQGVSRRGFIKGAIAASAAVSSSNYLFRGNGGTALAQSPAAGAVERLITLNINGRSRRVQAPPMETLSTTLRYTLGLTGTKIGCDRAECGACTVLLDGQPHYGCSVLTHSVRGREVTSIEGLEGEDGTLHPMQQAVLEEQGFQCAFCMSGFIMNTVALLNENQNPTRKDAAEWLSGNLCRCADYDKILTSVMRAAEITRGA
ncbi:MAG: (2Fe-2S)-binding protein [Acidobacteria bacterium]|mgnify:CR=1 FL=1|nr:(2Fe-2S)-binding protein [Acidobacteriota bacterium]|tara:strand:+ start:834 stop:1478 length:645 start_codon:yes stop_codon:yes gene_type:complete